MDLITVLMHFITMLNIQYSINTNNYFLNFRNYSLESKIKSLSDVSLPCLYKKRGCYFTGHRAELASHENDCSFRPTRCPIQACFEVSIIEN